jgi:hypothetical protein
MSEEGDSDPRCHSRVTRHRKRVHAPAPPEPISPADEKDDPPAWVKPFLEPVDKEQAAVAAIAAENRAKRPKPQWVTDDERKAEQRKSWVKMINVTPHVVSVTENPMERIHFHRSPWIVRLINPHGPTLTEKYQDCLEGVFAYTTAATFGGLEGMPPNDMNLPQNALIVSMPVGEYLRNNPSRWMGPVFGPDTSPDGAIRDKDGVIIGCNRLVLYKSAWTVTEDMARNGVSY